MKTLLSTALLTLGLLTPLGAAAQQADAAQPTDKELREAVRPWKLKPNGYVQKLKCPRGESCISGMDGGIFVIHRGPKKEKDEYFYVDPDRIRAAVGTKVSREKMQRLNERALRLHMKSRGVKKSTIPCHTVHRVPRLYWSKDVRTFKVADLSADGLPKTKVKVESSTPEKANKAHAALYQQIYERALYSSRSLFSDEELGKMKDPSLKTPTLRIDRMWISGQRGVGKHATGHFARRGQFAALYSPESTRVRHFAQRYETKGKSTAAQRKASRLKARRELSRGVYQMLGEAKVDTVSLDLETMCQVPEIFGADPQRLVVTF